MELRIGQRPVWRWRLSKRSEEGKFHLCTTPYDSLLFHNQPNHQVVSVCGEKLYQRPVRGWVEDMLLKEWGLSSPDAWWRQEESLRKEVGILACYSSVVSDSLQPHGLQHARLPCPSLSPGVCSNSCQWCHPTIHSKLKPEVSFCFCFLIEI